MRLNIVLYFGKFFGIMSTLKLDLTASKPPISLRYQEGINFQGCKVLPVSNLFISMICWVWTLELISLRHIPPFSVLEIRTLYKPV